MGRLIFNSEMGIVGVRGQVAHSVAYHPKGTLAGNLVYYGGAYSRKDVRGAANVLCKYPTSLFGKPGTDKQNQTRAKFRSAVEATDNIMANPEQLAVYRGLFQRQKKYVILRNFIFAKVWSTI